MTAIYCAPYGSHERPAPVRPEKQGAVLLIHRNVELRTALRKGLTARGFYVLEAANEQHAEMISRHASCPIDIFVTDRPDYEIARWHSVEFPDPGNGAAQRPPIHVCATFSNPELVSVVRDLAAKLIGDAGASFIDS